MPSSYYTPCQELDRCVELNSEEDYNISRGYII